MRKKYNFTLAEILVSMFVFSILLVLMMQFFTGARTLWTANEKRAAIYSDASTALDLMATLLQSTYCESDLKPSNPEDQTPFGIDTNNDKIYFRCKSLMALSAGESNDRFLSFQRKQNTLIVNILDDRHENFSGCSYEFNLPSSYSNDKDGAFKFIKSKLDALPSTSPEVGTESKIILRNIVDLKFTAFDTNGAKILPKSNAMLLPPSIVIELSLVENEELAKKFDTLSTDLQEQNKYTFRRTVWLGKRDVE